MKHLSILIPYGHTSIVNIEGTHQVFNYLNYFLESAGREPIFKIELVGLSSSATQSNGLFTVNSQRVINEVEKTDLIIIPAIHGDQEEAFRVNREFVPWILKQHGAGAEIASLCVGAFFLANTGLLNGKQCATHWIHAANFRKCFQK